jgi:hypothetical protein
MEKVEEGTVRIKDAYGELKVSKALLREMREAIEFIYPAMEPGIGYLAEPLLGPDIWDPPHGGRHRFLGRCLAWMERNRLIPIRRVTPMGKYPVRYAR